MCILRAGWPGSRRGTGDWVYTDDVGEYQPISDGAVMGILAAVLVRWGRGGGELRV